MNKSLTFSLILALSFFMNSSCSTLELESTWKDRDIELDGKGGDWLGAKYYFEDTAVSVGLINDAQYLYVSFMTENPMIRAQIMGQGLTVWLDPRGGKNKTFGVRYPLPRPEPGQGKEGMAPRDMMDEPALEKMMEKMQESMTELEVLGPDEKVLGKMDVENAKGIDVKMRNVGGTFVYELRVPLTASDEYPFAVGADPGDVIGVGFLVPKMKMRRPSGIRGGMPEGGGMPPGGGGGMGGGMGGMRGGGMGRTMPQRLKIWAKVQLASAATPTLSFL